MSNPLRETGKPLFFKLADASAVPMPDNRMGQTVRFAATSLSLMQKEGIALSGRTGASWRLASDEGAYLAGLDEAPCPLSFLTTGMICSTLNEILALAKTRGIAIRDVRLVQDNYYTMKGSALRGTMIGGARDVDLEARIDASADADTVRVLVSDAVAASPLSGLIRSVKESLFSLTHNGRAIVPGRVRPVCGVTPAQPLGIFRNSAPAAGDWSSLIVRDGPSPRTESTVTLANDSLREEQDRMLHVRGICTLRADGIKHVEQHLYNPHGSIFHFLCEEAPENGGAGRAPDAASYAAAGIGFCFMTQIGRYARILKKDLRSYRIIQDTHFSLGGASGGTGRAGEADPVETHVFIESGEDDDFARAALDMSEQTCFLHALCRTELKTRVRVAA